MLPRSLLRLAVHWLVILTMIATAAMVPAQAATGALQAAEAARMAGATADMPCGGEMDAPAAQHEMPCDCCAPASCDLSACLGTACLPALPRVAATIPLAVVHVRWNAPAPPSRVLDTPLRPPIG